MNISRFPRVSFAHLPTPLEELPNLQQAANVNPRLFVKRDDCTGLALGGNKARKLEYTMADAQAKGADVIITTGGLQSNHVRQTAAASAKLGLTFHGVLTDPLSGSPDHPGATYSTAGNRLLGELLGGNLHVVADDGPATEAKIESLVQQAQSEGRTPYVVPQGASDGIGAMGYVACAKELLDQFKLRGISPSHLVVATGSAGTHGGLLAGLRAMGSPIEVIGISVSEPAAAKQVKVQRIVDQITALWGESLPTIDDSDIVVYDDYVGAGYAVPTQAGMDAMRLVAQTEGILLDPVYTAKAMAGCLDLLRNGSLTEGRDVVFMHTGGAPALFAYPDLF